jgi:hypothetical protein
VSDIVKFDPQNVSEAMALSQMISSSALLPTHLRGKPADVLITILTGRELGLSPMQSIRGMYVVSGKAATSADLMVALTVSRPQCKYFRLVETNGQSATYETLREGMEKPVSLTFTLKQAQAAGLMGNATWQKYPDAMLRARCSSALVRAVYPDLLAGVYDKDELPQQEERPAPAPRALKSNVTVVEVASVTPPQAEPLHDAVTGEVVEEGIDASDAAALEAAGAEAVLLTSIEAIENIPHHKNWQGKHRSEVNALPMPNKARVVAAYKAKGEALKTAFLATGAALNASLNNEPPPAA